jgi:amino acid adenylation domain-containing protein
MPARSGPQAYRRPVSPDDWMMLAAPDGLVTEIQLCVEGNGAIDPVALTAAVAAAADACPGTRLVRRGRRWVDSGRSPAVRVAAAGGFDRARLDSPLLRSPLARRRGASCEVILVPGTPASVIFRAHHAVMDGKGAMFWQAQVFRALRGEAVEQARSRLTADDVLARVAAELGTDLPPKAVVERRGKWRPPLGELPAGPRGSLWRRRTIDGAHPAATAKVAREVVRHGGGPGRVLVPVDLRQYLPDLRTTGSASGSVKVLIDAADDWDNVQANLLTALSEHEYLASAGPRGLLRIPHPVLRRLCRWVDDQAAKNSKFLIRTGFLDYVACVSHLGAVDLASLCLDGFEATSCYSLGSVTFIPAVDIVECGGRTEITVAWRDGAGAAEATEALLDRIEERLSPRDRRGWDGNDTAREAQAATLTGLFAAQVRGTPDAVAVDPVAMNSDAMTSDALGPVTAGAATMSYAELDQRASALAALLRDRGIGRGDRVGIVSGRSPAVIVAVWGVLKAGAAYLPIDATYPDARIAQFLADSGAPVCLLEPAATARDCLPPHCAGIALDTLPAVAPVGWRDADVEPGDLAYVVYTSGSTGAPKGVEIEHRHVVNYVRWAIPAAGIDGATRMLLVPSISFDVAGCAFFLPLLAGGAVLPVRDVNAVTLRAALEDSDATAMAITPSHLDIINRAGVRHTTMRAVMTIGEVLRRATALRAREVLGPGCRILNQYGPAETTIVNTSHEFDPETDTEPGVPFGRPMDNNTMYVLDAHGRFAAPGEPGELYIGGAQVGRGYSGRPELTRQRFVRLADGRRVYRTGDIVRLLPSGELTFVSRVDDQVKVAGHRVEPAEVAQALERHPGVRQAAVVPRTRPGREGKELCGYVVAAENTVPADWKEFLSGLLPAYMVPATLTAVAEIPLNPNGKVDGKQLPDPFAVALAAPAETAGRTDPAGATAGGDGARAADDVTAAVAGIWARTLHIDVQRIDEQADFHELGGNSLLLLSMVDEVRQSVMEQGQAEFMDELARIIRQPTLGQVSGLVREIRERVKPGSAH